MSQRIGGLLVFLSLALPASATATQTPPAGVGLPSAAIWLNAKSAPSPARVSAEVTRAGKRRELTWWVLRRAGQRVTFEERGPTGARVLGSAKGGTGSLRFKPAKGAAGTRRIVARVEMNGVVTEELTVARFTVRRLRTRGMR